MSFVVGELAQVNPGAATLTTLYTVSAAEEVEGVITIANRSAVATSFRISTQIAAEADNVKQYKFYDVAIGGNVTIEVGPYFWAATDVIKVYATLATLSFTLNGRRKA